MSVKPETLQNPERGLDLQNREAEGKAPRKREEPVAAAGELEHLRERIAAAKATTPKDPIPHCGDCYRRGWTAALRSLEG